MVAPDPGAIGAGPATASQASAGGAAALPIPANPDLAAAPVTAPSGDAQTGAANDPAAAGSGLTMPHVASIRALAPAGPSNRTPAASPGNADSKSGGALANQAAVSATASTNDVSALNDQTSGYASTATGATAADTTAAGTDAAAQANMAAAMQDTNASSPSNSFANDPAPDDAGPQGVAVPSEPLAGAPATLIQASGAATSPVTAATAAAQAISSAAGAAAADKRSHGNGPALLSGASSDGSAGATQLLPRSRQPTTRPRPHSKSPRASIPRNLGKVLPNASRR